ncbi:MAG: YggS family pyridoxal phosphate-dependent enzyme [Bacteroidetes bacterium MED-G17]|nr:MAG: YggS family pyridoxal phosphate-dependent enzyme [Bacteroidetes bacterium MED-G17]|tara:strand:+ start:884 stop:1516 length:633 start_codon:yes stop_codon:yes gene_type:complete
MHQNIKEINAKLHGAKLIIVTKYQSLEKLNELYAIGPRNFGENRPQQMVDRYEIFPKDIRWHMIGNLQRNKVKLIAPFVYMIHSVDSLRLAQEIDKQAKICGRKIPCLLQLKIAQEESKGGYNKNQLMLDFPHLVLLKNLQIMGLMGMASNIDNAEQVRKEFQQLVKCRSMLEKDYGVGLTELSMGMSNDYEIAIQEGSTLVRIGSKVFA